MADFGIDVISFSAIMAFAVLYPVSPLHILFLCEWGSGTDYEKMSCGKMPEDVPH